MSVSLSDVRFQVQDQPRTFGAAPESPRALGTADGATTTFYLPLSRLQYVAGSAQLYATQIGSTPVGIASSTYTITQQGAVTFALAPGAGGSPIASGSVIGAAFQATGFADADLQTMLTNATALYGSDDRLLRKAVELDVIDVLLSNLELLATIREAEYEKNPAAVVSALVRLKAELRKDIENAARPNRGGPALQFGTFGIGRPYQPRR